jgi:hypothetical protein
MLKSKTDQFIASLVVTLPTLLVTASCSNKSEESNAAYQAACHGVPLRTAQKRNDALEDGYNINQQYDCIDKASFTAVEQQASERKAANLPKAPIESKADMVLAAAIFGDVTYGMSVADILGLVPGAKLVEINSQTIDGAKLIVEIDNFSFSGRTFTVGFWFLSNSLTRIHLRDTETMLTNESTRLAFEQVTNRMQQTYGKPVSSGLESRESGLFGGSEWIHDRARISVSILPLTQEHSIVLISFSAEKN